MTYSSLSFEHSNDYFSQSYSNKFNTIEYVAQSSNKKSFSFAGDFNQNCPSLFVANSSIQVSVTYDAVSAVSQATNMIASEISSLTPILYDTKNNTKIYDHPVLTLLKFPNLFNTYKRFMESLVAQFIVTGNAFLIAKGDVKKPPFQLVLAGRESITWSLSESSYIPETYFLTNLTGVDGILYDDLGYRKTLDFYYAKEISNILARYKTIDNEFELLHIRDVNPVSGCFEGLSKFAACMSEINQFAAANMHNLSILQRGARPGGYCIFPGDISQEQFDSFVEQLKTYYSGATNAGRPMALQGEMEFKEASFTNVDMDFLNLKLNARDAIFTALKIPLPLVSKEQMTLSNYNSAIENFYDNAVLPMSDYIYDYLTLYLLPRYKDLNVENFIITYDKDDITALASRRVTELKQLQETGVLTVNEIRAEIGREPLDGGNVIFRPNNQVPVALDTYTEDEPKIENKTNVNNTVNSTTTELNNNDNNEEQEKNYKKSTSKLSDSLTQEQKNKLIKILESQTN